MLSNICGTMAFVVRCRYNNQQAA